MQRCMEILSVNSVFNRDLIADENCHPSSCADQFKVAFHAYKSAGTYFKCWEQANDAVWGQEWHIDTVSA